MLFRLEYPLALRSKKAIDIIYLDFAKAVDSVVHKKLIAKLTSYGVNPILVKWIESCLVGRFQYVRIGSSKSKCSPVLSSVPQGSILVINKNNKQNWANLRPSRPMLPCGTPLKTGSI